MNDASNCSSQHAGGVGGGRERSREQVMVFECHLKFTFIILIVTVKISHSGLIMLGEKSELKPQSVKAGGVVSLTCKAAPEL